MSKSKQFSPLLFCLWYHFFAVCECGDWKICPALLSLQTVSVTDTDSLSLSTGRWLTFAGPALSEKLHFKDSNSTILSSAQLSSFFQPKPPADLCPGTYSTLLPPIFLLPWDYFLLATHFRGLRSPVKVISLHTLFCSLGCSESSSCLRICRAL